MEVNIMIAALLFIFLLTLKTVSCHLLEGNESKMAFRRLQREKKSTEMYVYQRRRAAPVDDFPILDLLEDENEIYNPHPSDINTRSLLKQLGSHYDKEYMSIHDPTSKAVTPELSRGRLKGPLPSYLHLARSARSQDGKKLKLNTTKDNRKKFQNFIWNWTFCPVKYSWKLLNVRYWPRWIKEGSCYSQRSCSFPPGMTCQPNKGMYMVFLRWNCRDYKQRLSCRWIPFEYPVLTECSCSCQR